MVVLGGVTRLTKSGLSIVEWQPLAGAVPPLSQADWETLFARYRETPQYQKVFADLGLEGFKSIFWWEYAHRLLGRLIGLFFFLPYLYFLIKRRLTTPLAWKLAGLLVLGGLQGAMGWFMVKSGLVDDPRVSHFRLTAHLGLALLIFSIEFWLALELIQGKDSTKKENIPFARRRLRFPHGPVGRHGGGPARRARLQHLPAHERQAVSPKSSGCSSPGGGTSSGTWRRCSSCTAADFWAAARAGSLAALVAGTPLTGETAAYHSCSACSRCQAALGIATLLLAVPVPARRRAPGRRRPAARLRALGRLRRAAPAQPVSTAAFAPNNARLGK